MARSLAGEGEAVAWEDSTSFPGCCLGAIISFEEMIGRVKTLMLCFEHQKEGKLSSQKINRESNFSKDRKSLIYRPHDLASQLPLYF